MAVKAFEVNPKSHQVNSVDIFCGWADETYWSQPKIFPGWQRWDAAWEELFFTALTVSSSEQNLHWNRSAFQRSNLTIRCIVNFSAIRCDSMHGRKVQCTGIDCNVVNYNVKWHSATKLDVKKCSFLDCCVVKGSWGTTKGGTEGPLSSCVHAMGIMMKRKRIMMRMVLT